MCGALIFTRNPHSSAVAESSRPITSRRVHANSGSVPVCAAPPPALEAKAPLPRTHPATGHIGEAALAQIPPCHRAGLDLPTGPQHRCGVILGPSLIADVRAVRH